MALKQLPKFGCPSETTREVKKKADSWTPPQTYQFSISVGKTENVPVFVPTASLWPDGDPWRAGSWGQSQGPPISCSCGQPPAPLLPGEGGGASEWKTRVLPATLVPTWVQRPGSHGHGRSLPVTWSAPHRLVYHHLLRTVLTEMISLSKHMTVSLFWPQASVS